MVHEGNKDEADKCFNLAKKYFEEGNREKAQKFAIKAQKLFPSQSFNDFIDLLNRLNTSQSNETSSSNRSSRADRSQDNENVRQRTSGSHSRPSSLSREYTQDQLDAVKKVKRCKDYYEILGVSKDTTDSDLKKAYRKLALQFHPDKNKAPGADEAFKAVGNAFAVLSDAEKKKNYDLFGHEELSQRSRNSSHMHNTSRGFEGLLTRFLGGLGLILKHYGSILVLLIVLIMLMGFWFLVLVIIGDVTAEELFNMFFGGGFPNSNGGVYVRRNGRWERPRYRNNTRRHSHDENQADQSGFSVILQLMPLILIVVLSLASSFFSSDPIYSLSATTKYNVVRTTRNLRINYFVKSDFNADSNIDIRRLEKQVEESYITTLRNGCYREKTNRDHMMAQARMFGDAKSYKRAYEAKTPSCDALNQLYYS